MNSYDSDNHSLAKLNYPDHLAIKLQRICLLLYVCFLIISNATHIKIRQSLSMTKLIPPQYQNSKARVCSCPISANKCHINFRPSLNKSLNHYGHIKSVLMAVIVLKYRNKSTGWNNNGQSNKLYFIYLLANSN